METSKGQLLTVLSYFAIGGCGFLAATNEALAFMIYPMIGLTSFAIGAGAALIVFMLIGGKGKSEMIITLLAADRIEDGSRHTNWTNYLAFIAFAGMCAAGYSTLAFVYILCEASVYYHAKEADKIVDNIIRLHDSGKEAEAKQFVGKIQKMASAIRDSNKNDDD